MKRIIIAIMSLAIAGLVFANWRGAFDDAYFSQVAVRDISPGNDDYTKLLLHCNGADASTNFPDSSSISNAVSAIGDAQVDTTKKKFGTGSCLLDGTADYLSTPSSTNWNISSSISWTVDFWVNVSVNSGYGEAIYARLPTGDEVLDGGQDYIYVVTSTSNLYFGAINAEWNTGVGPVITGVWNHIAMVYDGPGKMAYCFLNGAGASVTNPTVGPTTEGPFVVGKAFNINAFNGRIDEFRFSQGIARWTNSFTPPTQSYGE